MKLYLSIAFATSLMLSGCGENSFSGTNGKNKSKDDPDVKIIENEIGVIVDERNPTEGEIPTEGSGENTESSDATSNGGGDVSADAMACVLAAGGEPDDVVSVNGGDPDIQLKDGDVVLLDVKGNANLKLESSEVSKIKGLCIRAGGGADFTLDLSFAVGLVDYYGRGNAESVITFGPNGTLDQLTTDIAGSHSLSINGDNVDCDSIDYSEGGSSKVSCNGTNL